MIVEQQPGPISAKEAIAQIDYLRELIDETRLRVADWDYAHLFWGTAWIIGYLVTAWSVAPLDLSKPTGSQVGLTWLVVLTAAGTAQGMKSRRAAKMQPPTLLGRRLFAVTFLLFGATFVLPVIVGGMEMKYFNAYWPFMVGVIYAVHGIFIGRELVFGGAWLMAAAIASLFMPIWIGALWLAFAGGGGLIVAGLLLRRVRQ